MSNCAPSVFSEPGIVVPAISSGSESTERQLRSTVGRIITRILPRPISSERRKDFRYPYPHLIRMTPIDNQGNPIVDLTKVVVGKNITERGIDFFHSEALPYRRVVLTLESEDGTSASVVTDLLWTRFTRHGWYDNGGRFLQMLSQNGPDETAGKSLPSG